MQKIKNIKEWAEEDRPREKLILKGKEALTDAELLAILIGMGSREMSALDLGKSILKSVDNNLGNLTKLNLNNLKKFKGMGEAKSISILAALELGRRLQGHIDEEPLIIKSSSDIYTYLKPLLLDLNHEEFWLLLLNRRLQVLSRHKISKGSVTQTVVDPKIIFKIALENQATSIILAHNHPSGNLKPSQADIDITDKIKSASKLLDILLIDHLIFTNKGYYSFADDSQI